MFFWGFKNVFGGGWGRLKNVFWGWVGEVKNVLGAGGGG